MILFAFIVLIVFASVGAFLSFILFADGMRAGGITIGLLSALSIAGLVALALLSP